MQKKRDLKELVQEFAIIGNPKEAEYPWPKTLKYDGQDVLSGGRSIHITFEPVTLHVDYYGSEWSFEQGSELDPTKECVTVFAHSPFDRRGSFMTDVIMPGKDMSISFGYMWQPMVLVTYLTISDPPRIPTFDLGLQTKTYRSDDDHDSPFELPSLKGKIIIKGQCLNVESGKTIEGFAKFITDLKYLGRT
jgi:hypothetical protein